MKRPQAIVATSALVVASAMVGGALMSGALTEEDGPRGVDDAVNSALEAAGAAGVEETGSSVDSCTLISQAEAAAALGAEVTSMPNPSQCTYVAADGSARGLAVAVPDFAANRSQLKAGAEQTANALEGTVRSISAGDEAYAVVSTVASQGIGTSGGRFVVIVLTNPTGTADQQAAQLNGLLEKAFARL